MKFSKVIGKIDSKLVYQAEEKLSQIFLELATNYYNEYVGSGMGGDPLIFSLLYPIEHVCTLNIPTAATDGKRYYWNPKFILKQTKIGLRIICSHEAWHAIYMHPQRRGSRLPKLWNIAVDYIVNGTVMDDFKARHMNAKDQFTRNLGKYLTLKEYAEMLKDPFKGQEKMLDQATTSTPSVPLPAPGEDRELTPQEQKELEKREKKVTFFYADPDLEDDMKTPEKIYEYLYNLLPKCPSCGKVGMYKPPSKDKDKSKSKKQQNKKDNQSQDNQSQNNQSQGDDSQDQSKDCQQDCDHGQGCNHQDKSGSNSKSGGCNECGGGIDIFELGGTIDEHIDTDESEEKIAKRISDAVETTKKMAGHVPASLESELGKLTAPKITWQDIIRSRILKARSGNGKNDWTKFKVKPMFSGLLVPKRKSYYAHFGCLLDTSGSMSKEDMAFGLSQLQSLDERSEGIIVPADASIYWDKATKISKIIPEEISKVKVYGRGGTKFASFFTDYEKNIGKCDFLIVITDGYLLDTDIVDMINPGVDTIWLITSASNFKPPFGRVFNLHNS